MAKLVQELPDDTKTRIEVAEWDMRTLEGNKRYLQIGAKQLPSIALDGKVVFESLIPPQEELISEINTRWKNKND